MLLLEKRTHEGSGKLLWTEWMKQVVVGGSLVVVVGEEEGKGITRMLS